MSRRPPLLACLRLALLAMLMLGLCLQPVLAAVGEAHEVVAHAANADPQGQSGVDADDMGGDPAGADESPLHDLMHFAHCCGQVSTVLPPGLPKLVAQAPLRMPGGDVASLPLAKRPSPHDRPPIAN